MRWPSSPPRMAGEARRSRNERSGARPLPHPPYYPPSVQGAAWRGRGAAAVLAAPHARRGEARRSRDERSGARPLPHTPYFPPSVQGAAWRGRGAAAVPRRPAWHARRGGAATRREERREASPSPTLLWLEGHSLFHGSASVDEEFTRHLQVRSNRSASSRSSPALYPTPLCPTCSLAGRCCTGSTTRA